MEDILYIVVPCYNEEEVLPETSRRLKEKLEALMAAGSISRESRVLFVNDGSKDKTWQLIEELHQSSPIFSGVDLSRNRGHQNALLAGLMTAKERCDMAISMDADLQDDIDAVDAMVEQYYAGCDIVYGVRSSRKKDTFFKRFTAEGFYRLMNSGGDGVQPRRLPPYVPPGPGGTGTVQGGQPVPPGHRAHDRLPHRHCGV